MLRSQFGSCPSRDSPNDVIHYHVKTLAYGQETLTIFEQRTSQLEAHQGQCVIYVSTHVFEFPINTILAWIINDYHEKGNIIITNLLLPLGHISNSLPLALESTIQFTSLCDCNESNTHTVLGFDHLDAQCSSSLIQV